jgi:hypothetical protein
MKGSVAAPLCAMLDVPWPGPAVFYGLRGRGLVALLELEHFRWTTLCCELHTFKKALVVSGRTDTPQICSGQHRDPDPRFLSQLRRRAHLRGVSRRHCYLVLYLTWHGISGGLLASSASPNLAMHVLLAAQLLDHFQERLCEKSIPPCILFLLAYVQQLQLPTPIMPRLTPRHASAAIAREEC